MHNKFIICGNRAHLRTDEEMLSINKTIADEAFKKQKALLGKYLESQGFLKYKTSAYVRKNAIDLLEYIDLQKEKYGSKTFTVNYSLMPLYVPHDYLIIGFGGRLGGLICGKDIWWDYATNSAAEVSFQNVSEAIKIFLLPWFEKYSDEDYVRKELLKDKKRSGRIGLGIPYKNEEWLNAIDGCANRKEIIDGNIQRLKLPKTICRKKSY